MIAYLQGRIVWKKPPRLLLTVHGVGYELEAPMTVFYELPEVGAEVTLHTHVVVRDDAHLLYGFNGMESRDLFRALIKVNGVGPRIALAILSAMSPREFHDCLHTGAATSLHRIPGIGAKTARRLLLEMRETLDSVASAASGEAGVASGDEAQAEGGESASHARRDAIQALVALGYKQNDATRAVQRAVDEAATEFAGLSPVRRDTTESTTSAAPLTAETLIRAALQVVGGGA